MSTIRRAGALIIVLISTLSGCLSIETTVTYEDKESGTIEMEYRINEQYIVEDPVDSPPGMFPLPVSEQEVRRAASGIEQLDLEQYSTDTENGMRVVRARLSFQSLAALNEYYGAEPDTPAIYFENGHYMQRVFNGFDRPPDEDSLSFLEMAFADSYLKFAVSLPEEIRQVESGSQVADNEAEWRIELEDVAEETEPVYWRVSMDSAIR